jgi:peptidylprolyl isomerase
MLSKAERRAAGKAAAARRVADARRKKLLTNLGTGVGFIVAVLLIMAGCGVFSSSSKPSAADASATPTAEAAPSAQASFPPLPPGADARLGTKPTVTAGTGTLSKLVVTTLIPGTGPAVAAGQNLTVNYVGVSFKTGTEFDSSWKRAQPFDFVVGAGNVIKGWDQGLIGVKVGSRVQLDIPSNLAYGDSGNPGGPLRFVVDVLAAK